MLIDLWCRLVVLMDLWCWLVVSACVNRPKDGSKTLYVHQYDYVYNHEGSVLAWIEHKADCKRLIEALSDVTTVANRHLFWSESMYGQALIDYSGAVNKAKGTGTLRQEHIESGLSALDKRVFPQNAAALQMKYLLRFARKPLEMTARQAGIRHDVSLQ